MAELTTLARPYAKAAFELCFGCNKTCKAGLHRRACWQPFVQDDKVKAALTFSCLNCRSRKWQQFAEHLWF